MNRLLPVALPLLAVLTVGPALAQGDAVPRGQPLHAFTQDGDPPLYPADAPHFRYVNPGAPHAGALVVGTATTQQGADGCCASPIT